MSGADTPRTGHTHHPFTHSHLGASKQPHVPWGGANLSQTQSLDFAVLIDNAAMLCSVNFSATEPFYEFMSALLCRCLPAATDGDGVGPFGSPPLVRAGEINGETN